MVAVQQSLSREKEPQTLLEPRLLRLATQERKDLANLGIVYIYIDGFSKIHLV